MTSVGVGLREGDGQRAPHRQRRSAYTVGRRLRRHAHTGTLLGRLEWRTGQLAKFYMMFPYVEQTSTTTTTTTTTRATKTDGAEVRMKRKTMFVTAVTASELLTA